METETTIDSDLVNLFGEVFTTWREGRGSAPAEITLDADLWAQLEELGLSRLTSAAGSGAGWVEAAGLLRAAAENAAHSPFAETDLLAGWLLAAVGLDEGDSTVRTVAFADADGRAYDVAWAEAAGEILVLTEAEGQWSFARVDPAQASITSAGNASGLPRSTVEVNLSDVGERTQVTAEVVRELRLRGALARAIQMTGALDRVVQLSVTHATERTQFGRSLAKFQAVQRLIADAASEVAVANVAVDTAVVALDAGASVDDLELQVAIARSVVGHAAEVVVRNGHQTHGAIGTTFEHQLHEFTKPVVVWGSEYGSLHAWDRKVAEIVRANGADLWSVLSPAEGASA